jgi:hypothetical protein
MFEQHKVPPEGAKSLMENPSSGYKIVFSLLKFLKSVIPHPLPSLKTIKKNGIKNELPFISFHFLYYIIYRLIHITFQP